LKKNKKKDTKKQLKEWGINFLKKVKKNFEKKKWNKISRDKIERKQNKPRNE
jgi:hypothetical protein